MKLLFLGFCLFIALFGENVSAQKHKIDNNKHVLISNLYDHHYSVRNIINHKKMKRDTEEGINTFIKQLSDIALKSMKGLSDYGHKLIEVEEVGNVSRVCDVCQITINMTENNMYKVVEMGCVLHDSRASIRVTEVKQICNILYLYKESV
jgi:hypothetical protein